MSLVNSKNAYITMTLKYIIKEDKRFMGTSKVENK